MTGTNFISPIFAYALPMAMGWWTLNSFLKKRSFEHLFLGLGVACSVTTLLMFWNRWFFTDSHAAAIAIILMVIAALAYHSTPRKASAASAACAKATDAGVLVLAMVCALLFFFYTRQAPFGSGIDAWGIWRLKAIFFHQDPQFWQTLRSDAVVFAHPDYPLLYPLMQVWGWYLSGGPNLAANWYLSCLFTFCTVAVPALALMQKKLGYGILFALMLISNPHYLGMGSSGYADILVAYFFTASVVLYDKSLSLNSHRYACLAGFFAAASAWAKNEGLLFLLGILILSMYKKNLKHVLCGALPLIVTIIIFKQAHYFPSEKFEAAHFIATFTSGDGWSYARITAGAFAKELFRHHPWIWIMIASLVSLKELWRDYAWACGLFLFLNLGYACIYVISPLEIHHHIETTIDRLLLHSLPGMLYVSFQGILLKR
jgi:hypothetical protein